MMVEKTAKTERISNMATPVNEQFHREMLKILYDTCYDRVLAYCVRRVFSRAVAEDITSQTFLGAAKNIRSVRGRQQQDYVNWLFSIAVNQCNSYLRKNLRRQKLFEMYQQEFASDPYRTGGEMEPDWASVYRAMSRLKEIEQTIITLRFLEDMSYSRVAAIVKRSESSVRVILHRGLKKLRKLLNSAMRGES